MGSRISSYNIREARPQAGGVRDNNHNSSTFRPRTYSTVVCNGLSKDRAGHFLHALMCAADQHWPTYGNGNGTAEWN